MSTRTSPWPAGVPCWADLSSPDVAAARTFYAAALGWSFRETGDEYGGYVIAEAGGGAVAGIGPVQDEQQPAAWTLYVASDDADRTAADVAEHGGTVIMAPMDVGRWAACSSRATRRGACSASGPPASTSARRWSTSPAA